MYVDPRDYLSALDELKQLHAELNRSRLDNQLLAEELARERQVGDAIAMNQKQLQHDMAQKHSILVDVSNTQTKDLKDGLSGIENNLIDFMSKKFSQLNAVGKKGLELEQKYVGSRIEMFEMEQFIEKVRNEYMKSVKPVVKPTLNTLSKWVQKISNETFENCTATSTSKSNLHNPVSGRPKIKISDDSTQLKTTQSSLNIKKKSVLAKSRKSIIKGTESSRKL